MDRKEGDNFWSAQEGREKQKKQKRLQTSWYLNMFCLNAENSATNKKK
jgi:hypothetical protein